LQRALDATKQREATLTEQVHALQQRLDDERPSEKEQAAALKQKDHAIAAERTLIEDALDEERRREDDVLAAIERRQKDDAIAALDIERRQKDDALAALDGERRRAEDAMAALDAERRRADDAMAALDIERTRAEDVLTALNIERSRAEDALNQKAELEKELAIMSMFQRVEEADSDQEFRDAEPIAKKRKYRSVFSFADNKVIDTMFHAGGRRRMHHPPRLPAKARQWVTKPETSQPLSGRTGLYFWIRDLRYYSTRLWAILYVPRYKQQHRIRLWHFHSFLLLSLMETQSTAKIFSTKNCVIS
jgi:hypothetical protein